MARPRRDEHTVKVGPGRESGSHPWAARRSRRAWALGLGEVWWAYAWRSQRRLRTRLVASARWQPPCLTVLSSLSLASYVGGLRLSGTNARVPGEEGIMPVNINSIECLRMRPRSNPTPRGGFCPARRLRRGLCLVRWLRYGLRLARRLQHGLRLARPLGIIPPCPTPWDNSNQPSLKDLVFD
jgi:hypothetical protein